MELAILAIVLRLSRSHPFLITQRPTSRKWQLYHIRISRHSKNSHCRPNSKRQPCSKHLYKRCKRKVKGLVELLAPLQAIILRILWVLRLIKTESRLTINCLYLESQVAMVVQPLQWPRLLRLRSLIKISTHRRLYSMGVSHRRRKSPRLASWDILAANIDIIRQAMAKY